MGPTMATMTTKKETEACLARGYWFELYEPATTAFYGRWLEPWAAPEVAGARAVMYGEALGLCRTERAGPARRFPLHVRVQNPGPAA